MVVFTCVYYDYFLWNISLINHDCIYIQLLIFILARRSSSLALPWTRNTPYHSVLHQTSYFDVLDTENHRKNLIWNFSFHPNSHLTRHWPHFQGSGTSWLKLWRVGRDRSRHSRCTIWTTWYTRTSHAPPPPSPTWSRESRSLSTTAMVPASDKTSGQIYGVNFMLVCMWLVK